MLYDVSHLLGTCEYEALSCRAMVGACGRLLGIEGPLTPPLPLPAVMVLLYLSAELIVTDTTASGGIVSIIVYLCVVALVLR